MRKTLPALVLVFLITSVWAENGYRLWLRYDRIADAQLLKAYREQLGSFFVDGNSATAEATRTELLTGLSGLLDQKMTSAASFENSSLVCGTFSSASISKLKIAAIPTLGPEGFLIRTMQVGKKKTIIVAANTDIGVLYGAFHFLKLIQTHQPIDRLDCQSAPKIKIRMLNHWDNLDRTVERGYAGFSLWNWQKLPGYIDQRYIDYARANASIGINGTVLTNVNANALILRPDYLKKVKALADAFRPYGIRVYLTARFNAPMELDGFSTADPLDEKVQRWWKQKADEIYSVIPDFGGFLVKANSEGQPGPQNYKRNHADGANLLADAVQPQGGIVIWRAFVYSNEDQTDRAKQAYNEFKPLDGAFRKNVVVQVKNGAIDFQPREPFHPLFGAMPNTPLAVEFQITQEYLGFSSHLVYLAPLFKETLDSDTYSKGKGSLVARVIDGTLENHDLSVMAGVANIGTDFNWCGHPFAQSNWYALGRLAWNPDLRAEGIAEEWTRMTFTNDRATAATITQLMMSSRETTVNYMTPLGLHHIMGWDHHYGPGPWIKDKPRADWTSVYYHKADNKGIGFDRTSTGSNAVEQYYPAVRDSFADLKRIDEKYLLWFHHLPWDFKMKSGRTLWDELCHRYYEGVQAVAATQKKWDTLRDKIDDERFRHVQMLLQIQNEEATLWRDACVLYFQTHSQIPIPNGLEKPANTLDYYTKLTFPYAPGIRPQWK